MGLFEQARNITDTDLRLVLTASDRPVDALKEHILKLEGSLRELVREEEFLTRQQEWLNQAVERNLKLAEECEARASRMLSGGREDAAREALMEKKEALRQMSADRRQLDRHERTLWEVRRQRELLERRVEQARTIRTRVAAGQELRQSDLESPPTREPAGPRPVETRPPLSSQEEDEITRELEQLRRQVKGPVPEDRT